MPTTAPSQDATAATRTLRQRFAQSVGQTRYDRYFDSGRAIDLDPGTCTVSVASPFYADWLAKQFGKALHEDARAATGNPDIDLRWIVRSADQPADPTTPQSPASPTIQTRRRNARQARARHSLNEFVVGPCNRLACEAVTRLADPAHDPGFRLLLLHGSCGVGKTHLLGGLADRFQTLAPNLNVWWTTAESFTNQFVAALRESRAETFRRKARSADLICIDDAHFFAGKKSTQSEFLYTMDALEQTGARIALATDAHPRHIDRLEHRLVSRCMSGMIVEVAPPQRETRLAIVAELLRRRSLTASPRAIELLEQSAGPSVRDLEGAVTAADLVRRATAPDAQTIERTMVAAALNHTEQRMPRKPIHVPQILDAACARVGVTTADVLGKSRHKRIVLARSVTAHLARQLTTQSFPEIARALGRSNHSTVIAACQRVEQQIADRAPCAVGPDLDGLTVADLCASLRRDIAAA